MFYVNNKALIIVITYTYKHERTINVFDFPAEKKLQHYIYYNMQTFHHELATRRKQNFNRNIQSNQNKCSKCCLSYKALVESK